MTDSICSECPNPLTDEFYYNEDGEEICDLSVTGVWFSGTGWFQPNEVSHWMPLPLPPVDTP